MLVTSTAVSLFAAAVTCLAVIAYDLLRGRQLKILGAGSVVLFPAFGSYLILIDPQPERFGDQVRRRYRTVRSSRWLRLAIRQPFTLQYALEVVDAETAMLPGFIKANYIITWAGPPAMLPTMTGNILMIYLPGLPLWSGLAIAFAARNTAVYFTKWYPDYRKAKFATPTGSAGALSGS